MRISDWSSDVCSSDLLLRTPGAAAASEFGHARAGRRLARLLRRCRPRTPGIATLPIRRLACAVDGHHVAGSVNPVHAAVEKRSEERRVGKECVSTCRSRWSPYNYTKQKETKYNDNRYNNKT